MTVVIAGRPNAGKSSLLNRLAGYDAAIVTPIPGTTRDVLRERIDIDGMPLHVLDTAGLREGGDLVEEEGMRRAQAEMQRAERVLFVIDAAADPQAAAYQEERARLPADVPVTLVFNKCDLAAALPLADTRSGPPRVVISALTGEGLDRAARAPEGLHGLPERGGRRDQRTAPAPRGARPRAARTPRRRRGSSANGAPGSWWRRSCAPRSRRSARSPASSPARISSGGSSPGSASASSLAS